MNRPTATIVIARPKSFTASHEVRFFDQTMNVIYEMADQEAREGRILSPLDVYNIDLCVVLYVPRTLYCTSTVLPSYELLYWYLYLYTSCAFEAFHIRSTGFFPP